MKCPQEKVRETGDGEAVHKKVANYIEIRKCFGSSRDVKK
jgi:hypothetical protein